MNLYETLKRIKAKGYHPILAHPERYVYMDEAKYRKLKGTGVKFQLNLFSLTGSYGTEIKKKSKKLLSLGMYDVAGSDVHHLSVLGETSNIRIPAAAVWGEIISNRI
jgi:tyrosine-protein phosphatase YwqE